MAPRTRPGEPHEAFGDHINPVVNDVVDVPHEPLAQGQKPECSQGRLVFFGFREPVGGNLFQNEPVIREVLVKGPDHVVPVGPCMRIDRCTQLSNHPVPRGVRVPGYVQPVARPSFAVLWGGQKPVHEFLVGVGGRVRDKRGNLRSRGGKAGKVK